VMFFAGIAYLVAGLAVLLILLAGMRPMVRWDELRRHAPILKGSVWLIVGAASAEVNIRLYGFAVVGQFGTVALANLSAVQVVSRPAWMLSAAWSSIGFPQLSASRAKGDRPAFMRTLRHGIIATMLGSFVWSAIVVVSWPWISGTLYNGRYVAEGWLAYLWGISVVIGSAGVVLNAGMLAIGAFKRLAIADLAAAIVAMISMTIAMQFTYPMAIIATTMAQSTQVLLMALWLGKLLDQAIAHERVPETI